MLPCAISFYGRAFVEKFIQACGEDALSSPTLAVAISPEIELLVREAGTWAGLQYRRYLLLTGGLDA